MNLTQCSVIIEKYYIILLEIYLCVLMCSEIRAGLPPPDRLSLLLVYLA